MDKISIIGGNRLTNKIKLSGSKNAILPIMAAGLLTDQELVLNRVPMLSDVMFMKQLLEILGAEISIDSNIYNNDFNYNTESKMTISTKSIKSYEADYEIVRKMRASILVLGPLIARYGKAKVSLPGGCTIGLRPVNYHIEALKAIGVDVAIDNGYIIASGSIQSGEYRFPKITFTGTENLILASVLSNAEVVLHNTSIEPEVLDLIDCLCSMGAKIENHGERTIYIKGVSSLHQANHNIIVDHIEMCSYIIAIAMTKGNAFIYDADLSLIPYAIDLFKSIGIIIKEFENGISVSMDHKPESIFINTEPFPGFPTDLQAQIMALMTIANGRSVICENIWENRFMHVAELSRMGADISVKGEQAIITGVDQLYGANVMATDLRASMSLIIAGLAAKGETKISRIYHLDRGYEALENKLFTCGADIKRIK